MGYNEGNAPGYRLPPLRGFRRGRVAAAALAGPIPSFAFQVIANLATSDQRYAGY